MAHSGILVLLLNISAFKPQIEAAASAALEMDVRIKGRVGIALFPGFGLSLKDVGVRNKGLDVVTIEKMRIGLKLVSLARFKIKIIEVGLVRPIFSIVRFKNGMFNLKKPGRTSWEKLLAVEKISKESVFESIAGSVLNPLEDAWKFLQGKECKVFYAGSVAQPEG